MIFRNPENADKVLDSTGKGLGFLKIIAILGVIMILFSILIGVILYNMTWGGPYGTVKNAPTSSLIASVDGSNWTVQIVKINPQVSINSVHWYLLDVQGNTKTDGLVSDVYGYYSGQGKAVVFIDNDFNGKLSPGDKFEVHPGEAGSDLESVNDVSDFAFRMKFEPTGDVIGYDISLQS